MAWVENLKLRSKLGLILLLPIASLFILSATILTTQWLKQNRLEHLVQAGKFANVVTGLINELQLERGHSAIFLQNHGQLFHPELLLQRQASDKVWENLKAVTKQQKQTIQLANLIVITHKLRVLKKLREQIDQQKITASQMLERYNLLIQKIFNQLDAIAFDVNNSKISHLLTAYLGLLHSKELAGQERAIGSIILSSPATFEDYDRVINTLIIQQDLLLQLTSNQAPENIKLLLDNVSKLECVKQLEEKRIELKQRKIQAGNAQASNKRINQWFNISSCRIEQLRKIDLLYMQQIEVDINKLIMQARQYFKLILALTLFPILPSLLIIYWVDKNVNSILRWLLNAMQGIASGNLNISLPPKSKDELGSLSSGLDKLRWQLSTQQSGMQQRLLAEQQHNQELSKKILEIQQFASKIAAGDLRQSVAEDNTTMGQLSHSLNQMVNGLSALTLRIRGSSTTISSMVSELHHSINDQSAGASEQAASVNQTVITLEQLKTSSAQTLLKARTLGDIAENARHEGDNGREAIEQSIVDMKIVQNKMAAIAHTILTLNELIQRIGDITTSVHDIARQLRLISLNAAIEASNAGYAGKGFAVVAVEVKQLAERSQQSTISVQSILEEIRLATDHAVMATEEGSKGVELGLKQIQLTGKVVANLETAVGDTSLASRQIVLAVNQEVIGIEQISTAIKEIHTITGQFTATAEQSRNAAQKLADLVKHLDDTVNQYQL